MPARATEATSALYANLAKAMFARFYGKSLIFTVGDVVQLVRTLPCHGRGRGFESRRPRHSFSRTYRKHSNFAWAQKGTK